MGLDIIEEASPAHVDSIGKDTPKSNNPPISRGGLAMKNGITWGSLVGIVLSIISVTRLPAQDFFWRNDNYDFAGEHRLRYFGTDPDHYNIHIESNSDFRLFKLHIRNQIGFSGYWYVNALRVDMNTDGTWGQDWTQDLDKIVSYYYPNPPNGISATHTIKVETDFVLSGVGQHAYRTKYYTVTIFSTPRVYVNGDNDAFVQHPCVFTIGCADAAIGEW
jgi:hypothetical protein